MSRFRAADFADAIGYYFMSAVVVVVGAAMMIGVYRHVARGPARPPDQYSFGCALGLRIPCAERVVAEIGPLGIVD